MTTLYGIKNCDTVKKAIAWLRTNNIDFTFHDYRQDGLELSWLEEAEDKLGWELMLNKRGTTFRQLPDEQKHNIDKPKALDLLLAHPAMIKRPILIHQNQHFIGFKPNQFEEIFL